MKIAVIGSGSWGCAAAILLAKKMREDGKIVETAAFDELEKVKAYAKELKISKIIVVDDNVTEL